MTAPISLIPRRTGAHRSSEKIACTTCQMSNVCCAMFNVVVKAPDDLLTRLPNPNGNDLVIRSFRQWVVLQVHRTSHNRHSTFDSFGCRQFFHRSNRPPLQSILDPLP